MRPGRPMIFLAGSAILFHYWIGLFPDGRAPFAQAILHLSFLILVLGFCSEHCAELFDLAAANCMQILDRATTSVALAVYKLRQFFLELKRMDGIGRFHCICGSGKRMRDCCGGHHASPNTKRRHQRLSSIQRRKRDLS